MTLIIAINCKDGLVVASDSQVTKGQFKDTQYQKIYKISDSVLFAAAGSVSAIQDLKTILNRFKNDLNGELSVDTRQMIRSELGDYMASEMRMYHKTLQVGYKVMLPIGPDGRPQTVPQHLSSTIILAIQSQDGARKIWNISPSHAMNIMMDDYVMAGNGVEFAETLIHKYNNHYYKLKDLDTVKASMIAYRVIQETSDTSSYGVGGPIDIWIMNENGIKRLDSNELSGLEQAVRQLVKDEAKLLYAGISLQALNEQGKRPGEHNADLDGLLRDRISPPIKKSKVQK